MLEAQNTLVSILNSTVLTCCAPPARGWSPYKELDVRAALAIHSASIPEHCLTLADQ